jgi:signal transduction histidine kinase
MRRSLLVSLAALLAGVAFAAGVLALDGQGATALESAGLLTLGGAVWLAATHLITGARRQGRLSRQYLASVLGAVAVGLVFVLLTARLMVVSNRDAVAFAALLAFAGIVGTRAAALLAGRSASDLSELRQGLEAIAGGRLSHRVQVMGADEMGAVAAAVNWLAGELEAARLERERSELARRNLVAAVSHDLRTPIASLRLLVDAISDGVIPPERVDEAVATMDRHLGSLGALVDDLFDLARIDAGDIAWERPALDLREVVEETAEAFRPHAEPAGIELVVALTEPLPLVYASASRISRVLGNLIGNAIRHAPEASVVSIRGEAVESTGVRVSVEDDGAGIPFEDREQVFERFWRGANQRPSGGGSGLGLPICRAIVEAHGGEIWVDRDLASGTAVRFTLPTEPADEAHPAEKAAGPGAQITR